MTITKEQMSEVLEIARNINAPKYRKLKKYLDDTLFDANKDGFIVKDENGSLAIRETNS